MLPASLRYAFLALIIVCNVLFFWNVEIETGSGLAVALGLAPAKQDSRVTQTRMEQTNAYTFANPARIERQPR